MRDLEMKEFIRRMTSRFGIEISKTPERHLLETVSVKPDTACAGNVLLSYRTQPFLLKEEDPRMNDHITNWDCLLLGKAFLELGYSLDVIHWQNNKFLPEKDYAFFIDVHANLERIGTRLGGSCTKILRTVWAHWLFNNTAEYQRCLSLQQRRGVSIRPKRQLEPASAIEHADCAIVMGNQFTVGTYSFVRKPIYRVPVSAQAMYPWRVGKDYERCRKNFLWFGGYGLVHKGLDLVLEAFAGMPDLHLFVCGLIDKEGDFLKAYHRELYETENIHTVGWVDVDSPKFLEIADSCIGLIYPSCSEGQSGCVANCLHAGLLPIISYESGVDVEGFGVILDDCSVEAIRDSVHGISRLPFGELRTMSQRAWEYARSNHTLESVQAQFRRVIDDIVRDNGSHEGSGAIVESRKPLSGKKAESGAVHVRGVPAEPIEREERNSAQALHLDERSIR